MAISWQILIDWANDGSFAHDECARVLALRVERGRRSALDVFEAGKATLWLENNDRRFDPYYPSSPLYPNILPRRGVRILAQDADYFELLINGGDLLAVSDTDTLGQGAGLQYLFAGYIEDVEPAGSIGSRVVCITAYDGLRVLGAADVVVELRKAIVASGAVTAVLDAAGWPAAAREIDLSSDDMAYYWTLPETNAKQECDRLARSEYGAFFMTRGGDARFISRANYTADAPTTSLDEAILTDIQVTTPWASIYNDVRVRCYPVAAAALADIWRLAGLELAAGASLTLWVEYTDANGSRTAADGVVAPEAVTDYTANAAADGSGADMTANLTVDATIYSTWAKLVVTNSHATDALFVTLLKLRGQALTRQAAQLRYEDAASQGVFGRRQQTLELATQQDVAIADSLSSGLLAFYSQPAPIVTVRLDNRLAEIMQFELANLVAFTADQYSLSAHMRLDYLSIWTGVTMQDLKAELVLATAHTQSARWRLGDSGQSELGETTYLGW